MKTYLVTGAAGFIGSNFVKYMLQKHNDIRIVVLDALTYAGNLSTIAEDIDNDRCTFIRGNICDRALVDRLFVRCGCKFCGRKSCGPQHRKPAAVPSDKYTRYAKPYGLRPQCVGERKRF